MGITAELEQAKRDAARLDADAAALRRQKARTRRNASEREGQLRSRVRSLEVSLKAARKSNKKVCGGARIGKHCL